MTYDERLCPMPPHRGGHGDGREHDARIAELEAEAERLSYLLEQPCPFCGNGANRVYREAIEREHGGGRESGPTGDTKPSRVDTGKAAANPAAPVASIGGAWHKHGDVVYPDCPECFRIQKDMARELIARKERDG